MSIQPNEPCKLHCQDSRETQMRGSRECMDSAQRNKIVGSSMENDKDDPLHNYIVIVRKTIPIVDHPPQSTPTLENQDSGCNDHSKYHISDNDVSSCVSNLSIDESHCSFHHCIDSHELRMHEEVEDARGPHRPQLCNKQSISTLNQISSDFKPKCKNRSMTTRSRRCSFSRQPVTNIETSELMRKKSSSISTMSLTNKSIPSLHGREAVEEGILNKETETSNDSPDHSPIIVNGRVVHNIKRRVRSNDNISYRWGGSGSTENLERNCLIQERTVGYGSFTDSSPSTGGFVKLQYSTSFISQSENIQTPLEHSLNHSHTIMVPNDSATRSDRNMASSSTALLSELSCETNKGKKKIKVGSKKNKRSKKNDIKYLVKKVIPTPLQDLKELFTKTKSCELKRSNGCLV